MDKAFLKLIFLIALMFVAADLPPAFAILPSDQTMPSVPPFVPLDQLPCLK
ncbi:hypothetical protein FRX31_018623, partial [Thalictrum thalictroides]